jgi:DNA-binding Lrp family transcriptional regulator
MNILFKENDITFGELRKRLDISEGSLHNHFKNLEKDNIVTCRKEF